MGNKSSSSSGSNKSTIIVDADVETGSHVLTVHGFSKTLGYGVGNSINSGTFTVGGHSWYIAYYPEGKTVSASNNNSMSVFVYLDKPGTQDDDTVKAWIMIRLLSKNGTTFPLYYLEESNRTFSQVLTFSLAADRGVRGWGQNRSKRGSEFSRSVKKHDCFKIKCNVTVIKENRVQTITSSSPLTVPPPDLHHHLARLLESHVGADVKFEVRGELFTAHKAVLANRSPVFMAELFGYMKEKVTSKVRIDDMDPNAFRAMLYFIYTDSLPKIVDGDMAAMSQHLLVAADKYNLERLKLICVNKLCGYVDSKTVVTMLSLAEQHGCECLKEASLLRDLLAKVAS